MKSLIVELFCVLGFSFSMCGYCVNAEDGTKYCPDVINKEETTFVIQGNCYHYVEKHDIAMISHSFASRDCATRGGYLGIIKDQQTQTAVFQKLNMELADSHTIILGLKRLGSIWKWSDGSVASYTNWKRGTNQTFNCVYMDLRDDNGGWQTFDCAQQDWYSAYLCEHNKLSSSGGRPVASFSVILSTVLLVVLVGLKSHV